MLLLILVSNIKDHHHVDFRCVRMDFCILKSDYVLVCSTVEVLVVHSTGDKLHHSSFCVNSLVARLLLLLQSYS